MHKLKINYRLTNNTFIFILLSCFLFTLPVIYTETSYFEQVSTVNINAMAGWYLFGRPGADFLSRLLTQTLYGYSFADWFPFLLLLNVCFIAWVLKYVALNTEKNLTWPNAIPYILLFINPFILPNLYYRLDCFPILLGMGLTILASFFPDKNSLKSYLIPCLLLLAALTLYQPCINLFIGLYAANVLLAFRTKNSDPIHETLRSGLILVLANLGYYFLSHILLNLNTGWGDIIAPNEFHQTFLMAMQEITATILPLFSSKLAIFLYPMLVCTSYIFIQRLYTYWQQTANSLEFWFGLIIILGAPIILYSSLLGPLLFLKQRIVDIKTLPGVSAIFFTLSYATYLVLKKTHQYTTTLMLLPLFYSLAFSFHFNQSIKILSQEDGLFFSFADYELVLLLTSIEKSTYQYPDILLNTPYLSSFKPLNVRFY